MGDGKTSIIKRLCGHPFSSTYKNTIGTDVSSANNIVDNISIKYEFWDTAGQ
jgi:Ras-related protein Rab-7A